MNKIVFVTGGNRSGKSDFAQKYAESIEGIRTYIATAIAFDEEMKMRIIKHQKKRDTKWQKLIEEPYKLSEAIVKLQGKTDVALVDCITLWLNNLLFKFKNDEDKIYKIIDDLIKKINNVNYNLFIVSNEVGMGIVPENKLARFFRDISGITNQKLASISDEFYICFSGYTLRLK